MKTLLVISLCSLGLLAPPTFAQVFQVGTAGFVLETNNWPPNENPEDAIDGFGQKYLNFGREDTGVAVTPAGGSSVARAITLWTANDSGVSRDPTSFAIYGTNVAITTTNPGDIVCGLTLVAADVIALPASRSPGGTAPLDPDNSATVAFANDTAYSTYVVVFPTVVSSFANSMQVGEIQLLDAAGAPLFTPTDAVLGGELSFLPSVIPTVSEWGLIVLALLMLTAGTIMLRREMAGRGVGSSAG